MDPEVYTLLHQVAARNVTVRLLNIYKGLPISNDAAVLSVDQSTALVRCPKYQMASLVLERGTFIQIDGVSGAIRGQVYSMSAEREEAVLTNLIYIDGGIGMRSQVRVEPPEPLWVQLRVRKDTPAVMVALSDISTTGVGIYLERFYFVPNVYRVGAEFYVTIELPGAGNVTQRATGSLSAPSSDMNSRFSREALRGIGSSGPDPAPRRDRPVETTDNVGRVNTPAKIQNLRAEPEYNRLRFGLRIFPDLNSQQMISRYISQRQSDIIREFRNIAEDFIRRQAVKNQAG